MTQEPKSDGIWEMVKCVDEVMLLGKGMRYVFVSNHSIASYNQFSTIKSLTFLGQ